MMKRLNLLLALAGAVLAVGVGVGCGSQSSGDYGGEHPDYGKALAGSPPPLAALHQQAGELLDGGISAYEKRIADLRGYPVVTNVWASWCVPCRSEFPLLQKLSARYGKRVAFLGINFEDFNDAAETFLEEAPVPYPSYTDPHGELSDSLGPSVGLPNTAFYDRNGNLVYLKQGQYADQSELEADVRRYALKGA
jgi:cytochrome c biogenesis protein CcmG/thiol:disulfide interchange protein DsbE